MSRANRAVSAIVALVIGGLLLTGCAAIRDFVTQGPVDLPSPSLPTAGPPLEKIYQGGSRPEGLTEEEWATKSQRRIIAIGALHGVAVYSVDHEEGSDAVTVRIKGDPEDPQLVSDVETYVVPVALSWSPTVTVIIDPSICGVVSEFRDSKICDLLAAG